MFLKVPRDSRYEIKFIAYEHQYSLILNWIKLNRLNFFKEHEPRIVNNVYFDSINYNSFSSNIFGDSSRTKLRYRWYGDFEKKNSGYLEIKYKRNLNGWKKKINISNFKISENTNWKESCELISKDLPKLYKSYFIDNSNPQIINQYHRDYFISHDSKIRITVDKKHFIYDQRFHKSPNFKKKTFAQRILVMEFKFDRNSTKDINNLVKDIPIRASRNSKYVNSIRAVTGS